MLHEPKASVSAVVTNTFAVSVPGFTGKINHPLFFGVAGWKRCDLAMHPHGEQSGNLLSMGERGGGA